ncbi:transmembrane prolyl 4-hydroxylase-like [Montipora foliosa]|uniref:transmembrane prolyl 4-hydroxylase-like n=1 Tax=Montipora foliosa TaxID=591990 RepID=UPI0035F0FCB6
MSQQIRFCILFFLIKCKLSIFNGLDIKPIKGETCTLSDEQSDADEENPCFKKGLYSPRDVRLSRREGISLGHKETVTIDEEKNLQLITRSMKPPIFEIEDFLSHEESDHLISLAERNGLEESTIGHDGAVVTREGVNATLTDRQMQIHCGRIIRFDSNKDGNVSLNEFAGYAYRMKRALVDVNDLWTVYKTLLPEGARVFTLQNCTTKLNRTNFVEFFYQLFHLKRLPYFRVRHSEHTWVNLEDKDPVLKRIKRRIAAVSQTSISHVEHSEDLQVVSYQQDGHYHAHYDSSEGEKLKEKRCCPKYEDKDQSPCLLCRYITILIYLNNVTKGGETVFPVADREDLLHAQNGGRNPDCNNASLVVNPVKGRALMWYNNVLDAETGKMGEVDKFSLHAGCHVIEGEKWIANMWINAPRGDETV